MHSYSRPALAITFYALWDVNWRLEEQNGEIFREKKKTHKLTQPLCSYRKINTHPSHLDDWKQLKQVPISSPKVKLLDIYFPMGLHVTARAGAASALGVSVYDVLAAIHKQFKKKVYFPPCNSFPCVQILIPPPVFFFPIPVFPISDIY